MSNILTKIFGTKNDRELKRISLILDEINAFEEPIRKLSDNDLREKTDYFREKLAGGAEPI